MCIRDSSNVLLNGMTLHNGTTRNTTEVLLAGEGAEINLCGMATVSYTHLDVYKRQRKSGIVSAKRRWM